MNDYLDRQTAGQENQPDSVQQAWSTFCQALFASAEFRYLIDAPPRDADSDTPARVAKNPG